MNATRWITIACASFALAMSGTGFAEAVTLRGRPGEAKDVLLMELTTSGRLTDQTVYPNGNEGSGFMIDWSLGMLHNTSDRSAFGGAMKIAFDDDGNRFGFTGRYRRWLSDDASIDVAPGLFISSLQSGSAYAFPSPALDVALNYKDKIGLVLGAENVRFSGGQSELRIRAGVRFGGWLAPAGTALLFGGAALAFAGN